MKALITGAAQGLGRALTEELLANGHEVVAVDRNTDSLDELALRSRGACTVRLADMENEESIIRLIEALATQKFDLVILNAGISATGRFEDIPAAAYAKLISVNLTAPLIMASSLVRREMMEMRGKIVFISSLSHAVGYPGASVYAATKDAIAVYAKSVRKPFKKSGVRVLTVYPGPIDTEHAAKHAPVGSKANKRMAPEKLAKIILKTARGKSKELYPGFGAQMASYAGSLAPKLTTKAMRKAIYDKLDRPSY